MFLQEGIFGQMVKISSMELVMELDILEESMKALSVLANTIR